MIGCALGRHLVQAQLELGKLRLPEDRSLDVLEVAAEDRQPRVVVLHLLEHVVDEQRLVERGGDLGDEDRVIGGGVGLRLCREIALHRVAQLVGQRAHVVVLAVVVDQHVRVDAEDAVRVGARTLAVVREQVDPALGECLLDGGRVLVAERLHRVEHELLRVFRRVREVHRRHERRVEIVVVQLVHAHHALAQLQIAMERGQVAVHALDEARL